MIEFVESMMDNATVAARLDDDLKEDLQKFLVKHGGLLDQWHGEPCLTHSDFGGSNILMEQKEQDWQVAAVLDWEFAFSGNPFFDFGNLLRKPLGGLPGFEQAVLDGYKNSGSNLPPEWRKMSLLTDLTAWLDFLSRPSATEPLVVDALTTIRTTINMW